MPHESPDQRTQTSVCAITGPDTAVGGLQEGVQARFQSTCAIGFAKQSAEAGFGLVSELAKAKDVKEVSALQSRYAQAQMQAYSRQAQELSQLVAQATQSVQPRGERARRRRTENRLG